MVSNVPKVSGGWNGDWKYVNGGLGWNGDWKYVNGSLTCVAVVSSFPVFFKQGCP